LDEAFAEAKKINKPVFVDVSASWCKPCRMMDRAVFPDDSVRQILQERYIPVRVDGDDTTSGKLIRDRYSVRAYPTFLILSPAGGMIRRETGFQARDEFLAWLKDSTNSLLSRWGSLVQAQAVAQVQKKLVLAVVLRTASMFTAASSYFDNAEARKIIDSLYIPTTLVQRLPSDSSALRQLGYTDFPLSDDDENGFGNIGLVVVMDANLREITRIILERKMLEDVRLLNDRLWKAAAIPEMLKPQGVSTYPAKAGR
jgi:thiol-disulfide isomerase/thioredoxin